VYSEKGLQIDIRADQLLNSWDGEAHTVKLAIYQLSENSAFIEKQKSNQELLNLLKVKKFDPTVVGYEQLIIQPNESRIISVDRVNQAKWIGIVAGYFRTDSTPVPSTLVKIPTVSKKKSGLRKAGEFLKILQPYEIVYVPQIAIQLILTPLTMYETSIFR
jgi:type VI secretion system VasD/TssJ family lipoprotein